MRSCMIVGVLACAALGSGCSTAHILLPRRSAPPGVEARADSLRTEAWAALAEADAERLTRALGAGAVIVLPSGDTLRDATALASALTTFAPAAAQLDPTFFREGEHWCTDAFVEYGTFGLYRDGDRTPVRAGRLTMLWDVSDPAHVRLRTAWIRPPGDDMRHRARPCATPMDSVFATHRVTLTAHAVASVASTWESGLRGQLDGAGWGVPDPHDFPPHATEISPVGAVRVRVAGPLIAGAFGSGVRGMDHAEHPDLTIAALQYDGLLVGALLGLQWGFVSASAGPAYLSLDGAWRTMGGPPDAPPPSFTVARDWSAWSVGATGELGVMVPLTTRFALDGRFHYRYFPDVAVPGYRGSLPVHIGFSHSVLLLGMGASF